VDSRHSWYCQCEEVLLYHLTAANMSALQHAPNPCTGLLVFAEWYDLDTIRRLRFYDDNTRSWWDAATGGANIPALNDLLAPFGAALGGGVLDGSVAFAGVDPFRMSSGSRLAAWPAGGHVYNATLTQTGV
jgi:membrane-bound transcription factor site-1 protease